jgi:uncharacterized protein (DUF2249 family)
MGFYANFPNLGIYSKWIPTESANELSRCTHGQWFVEETEYGPEAALITGERFEWKKSWVMEQGRAK